MKFIKKSLITSTLLLLASTTTVSFAHNHEASQQSVTPQDLKTVMQGLLKDTHLLTTAMLTENFTVIELAASNIANHPKPPMQVRKKLMMAMGADMAKFKANDNIVHGAAVAMVESAQNKDIKAVGKNYQTMIGGCLSCHAEFKTKVSGIFSE